MSFTIFQSGKTAFQAIKNRSSKSGKIDIFPKGLTDGFGPKMAIFPTFFFRQRRQENVFYNILEQKNAFLGYKNKKLKQSKIDFFPKGLSHRFRPKIAIFPSFFFQAIQARKMSFMMLQNEKTPFQAIKTRRSKSRKIDIFRKGRKGNIGNIGQENVFHYILERKNAFLGYKTRSSNSLKLTFFQRG